MLPFELTKDTPYLALSGELWSVFYEYFNRNWPCYKEFLLYYIDVLFDDLDGLSYSPNTTLSTLFSQDCCSLMTMFVFSYFALLIVKISVIIQMALNYFNTVVLLKKKCPW